jgi:hypothetical protein
MIGNPKGTKRSGVVSGHQSYDAPTYSSICRFDGDTKLTPNAAVNIRIGFHALKNIDGMYYIALMGRIDKNRDIYIIKYNPLTNEVEQEQRIIIGIATQDIHRSPCIDIDSDGNILVLFEELIAPNSHGSPLRIYKTTTPFDLSTLTLLNTITFRWSNPVFWVNGSNITVGARGTNSSVTFIRGQFWYYTSTDGGATFSSPIKVYDSDNEDTQVAYVTKIHSYDGTEYYVYNERSNTQATWTLVAVFKRISGSTFGNVDGSWTKDVVATSSITRTEMVTNCLVYESTDYASINVFQHMGCVKTIDGIRLVVSVATATGQVFEGNPFLATDEVRFYTYSGGWSYNAFPLPYTDAGIVSSIDYVNNDEEGVDEIAICDFNHGRDGFVLRSTDNFATHETIKVIQGYNKYKLGGSAYNVETKEEQLFLMTETKGNIYELLSENEIDYANLIIVKR